MSASARSMARAWPHMSGDVQEAGRPALNRSHVVARPKEAAAVRDRDHLGAVRVIPRQGQGRDGARDFAGDWANRPGDLPLHPCLSGRAGAVFYIPCRWAAWRVDPAVAHHQVGRPRCRDRERWHGHSPSCGRARPSAMVRSPAPTTVCRCTQGGQGDLGSAWLAQSGRADRSLGPHRALL